MTLIINADSLSIVSAVVAVIAMFISLRQARIEGKSYKLNKNMYEDRKPKFKFNDIIDCYVVNDYREAIVHFKALIFLENLSDRSMVIDKVYLRLVGEEQELVLWPTLKDNFVNCGEVIANNGSLTKWIQFDVSRQQYNDLKIIKYTIIVRDTNENESSKSTIVVREDVTKSE